MFLYVVLVYAIIQPALNLVAVPMVTVQCLHVGCQRDGWQGGGGASHEAGATRLHAAGATVRICDGRQKYNTPHYNMNRL